MTCYDTKSFILIQLCWKEQLQNPELTIQKYQQYGGIISMQTVVEFYSASGEIQLVFINEPIQNNF